MIFLGNSSQVSDGAAAVLLMKRSIAMQKGLPILGVFRCSNNNICDYINCPLNDTIGFSIVLSIFVPVQLISKMRQSSSITFSCWCSDYT
ncbi:hypothetical protein KY284_001176 [Solanum tuberosum]|nr:hypothetical protein KY284_001176 [Solanum tuberosum]